MTNKAFPFIWKNLKSVLMICPFAIVLIAGNPYSASGQDLHAQNLMPVYPGGLAAIKETIVSNLHYPEASLKAGISGTVLVNFTIDHAGEVQNIKVMQGISPECDAEAVRVTGLLKGWSPGVRNGKPVEITVSVPVEFKSDKKVNPGTVSGRVTEKTSGNPVEGAFVIVKDTYVGSVTIEDGSYRIELPPESKDLIIFAVGYSSEEILIDFHSTINIELETEYQVLDFNAPVE
jgi:protein TonB